MRTLLGGFVNDESASELCAQMTFVSLFFRLLPNIHLKCLRWLAALFGARSNQASKH